MRRSALIPCAVLSGLSACTAFETTPADPLAPEIVPVGGGVFSVQAALPGDGNDKRLHCAAARHAEAQGAPELNWIEGLLQTQDGADQSAKYRYFAPYAVGGALPAGEVDKVFGGAQPIADWFVGCAGGQT